MIRLDETHDPAARSWVASAQAEGCDFPIQNLPFGVFRRAGTNEAFRGGIAIGDRILDIGRVHAGGHFTGEAAVAAAHAARPELNGFLALGPRYWRALRLAAFRLLRDDSPARDALAGCLVEQSAAQYRVPARIGDYTDMYASIHHATNIGRLFRPDNPLMPNFQWLPVGYHGRASSIGVSGQSFHRPRGQTMPPGASAPVFGECRRLDYELEVGIWIGTGNALGEPIPIDDAESHVFGLCLLNDWSARDIQAWEYQPLGPFQAKAFATTISPWIVTQEALEPFRVWTPEREKPLLAYLEEEAPYNFDIELTARLQPVGEAPATICRTNTRGLYYSFAQQVAHHTSSGCALCTGDLIGSGTVSGSTPESCGSLLELTWNGRNPLRIGQRQRTFLEDGDRLHLRGRCSRGGAVTIGFGPCDGRILQAR